MKEGISASVWKQGIPPRFMTKESEWREGIAWFEIGTDVTSVQDVFDEVGSLCRGLTQEILEEILQQDPSPDRDAFGDIRVVSTFQVRIDPDEDPMYLPGEPTEPGTLVFDPVEICVGDDWMISKRHPSFRIEGDKEVPETSTPNLDEATDSLIDIWTEYDGNTPSDLATMLMIELSTSYEEAQRHLRHWTEDWELELYRDPEQANESELIHI